MAVKEEAASTAEVYPQEARPEAATLEEEAFQEEAHQEEEAHRAAAHQEAVFLEEDFPAHVREGDVHTTSDRTSSCWRSLVRMAEA